MNHQDLSIDEFLDRLTYMPDEEALLELKMRRERHAGEIAMLRTTQHDLTLAGKTKASPKVRAAGLAIAIVSADLTRINEAIRETNLRMERATWAKAVTAVYGQEGYERCRIWMFQNNPARAVNFKGLGRLIDKYGITSDGNRP